MSKTRKMFAEGDVMRDGPHGGVWTLHRFGTDGNWAGVTHEAIAAELEIDLHVHGGMTVLWYCADCDSIATELRGTGIPYEIGITHTPACPWLAAAPPPVGG